MMTEIGTKWQLKREEEPIGRSQGPHPGSWFGQCGLVTLVCSFILGVAGGLLPVYWLSARSSLQNQLTQCHTDFRPFSPCL